VRELFDQVCDLAGQHGLDLGERIEMSANNPSLVFPRQTP